MTPRTERLARGSALLFDETFLRKLEQLELLARKIFRGLLRGERTTLRRGQGLEFSDFRHYRPGDDFRHIDPGSARILLVEGGPAVLSAFPENLRESARRDLARLGVDVRLGTMVTDVQPGRVEMGGESIDAETIIWAAGVAASPLGATIGTPTDRAGRVLIEPDLTVPGHPNLFVIGDLAALGGADGRPLPGVAQVAIQMGRHAAANITRALENQPYRPFTYRDLGNMATIGRASAVADFGWIRLHGAPAWWLWGLVHVGFLVGLRNRVSVMLDWFWSYLTYRSGTRLITNAGGAAPPAAAEVQPAALPQRVAA